MTDQNPGSDDDHITAIGRLTVLTAEIEYHLAGVTALLVAPDVIEVGMQVVGKQRFAQLATLCRQLLPARCGPDSPASDLHDSVADWIDAAQRVMQWRNELLHSVWMIYGKSRTATVLKRDGATRDVPLAKMNTYVEDAVAVTEWGSDLWFELTARFGHFDALIAATLQLEADGQAT